MLRSSADQSVSSRSNMPSSAAATAEPAATTAVLAGPRSAAVSTTLQDAMLTVPDEDKTAYLEAVEKDAELVQRESDPMRFLECERNDPWKAAKRLACYWKQRKDIFGAERAFLPLHQTGGGAALNDEDLEILNTGALVVLPNDNKGRSVIAADITRFGPAHTFQYYFASKLRMVFYILSIVAENKMTQKTGIVFLSLIATNPDSELTKRSMTLIHEALPIWTMETHVLFLPSRATFGSFIVKIIELANDLLSYFAPIASFHRGKSDDEVLSKLIKSHGLSKRGIPEWMGGSWTMENFDNWKKRRARMEQSLLLTAEEKLQRKRQINALHSRKKRERQKSQIAILEEECATLRATKEQLIAENRQLEEQVEYARSEAAILEYLEQEQADTNNTDVSTHSSVPAAAAISGGQVLAPSSGNSSKPAEDSSLWNLFDNDPF